MNDSGSQTPAHGPNSCTAKRALVDLMAMAATSGALLRCRVFEAAQAVADEYEGYRARITDEEVREGETVPMTCLGLDALVAALEHKSELEKLVEKARDEQAE